MDTGVSTCSYSEFLEHSAVTSLHTPAVTPSEKPVPDICPWPFHTPLFVRLPWVFLPSSCCSTITCCCACLLGSVHAVMSVIQPWGHMYYPTHGVLIPIIEPNTKKKYLMDQWVCDVSLFALLTNCLTTFYNKPNMCCSILVHSFIKEGVTKLESRNCNILTMEVASWPLSSWFNVKKLEQLKSNDKMTSQIKIAIVTEVRWSVHKLLYILPVQEQTNSR